MKLIKTPITTDQTTSTALAEKQEQNQSKEKFQSKPISYHIVFSTSCRPQQHWESYVLFFHAWKVGQPGNITRIMSGCNERETEEQFQFHEKYIRTMSKNFHLHPTPNYAKVTSKFYKYMNKPFGLVHWFENFLHYPQRKEYNDDIVILMDPDQILIRPMVHDFRNEPSVSFVMDDANKVVSHGNPMAQQDGYLHNKWRVLNLSQITGDADTPAYKTSFQDGPHYYNSGPPYLATVQDMYSLAIKWKEFAPRVYEEFPKLFAEMFGYVIASAHLKLPHTLVKSLVISTTYSSNREGWSLVDGLDHVCPMDADPSNLPHILHYCKRYLLGKMFWSKYRLRKDILNCEPPLLEEPKPTLPNLRWWIAPPAHGSTEYNRTPHVVSDTVAKREAFMLCALIPKVNEAVSHFKQTACGKSANYSKVYNFFNMP